jgi:hypothetical protein
MALGESKASIEEMILRSLAREGEGTIEPAMARRIATAVAEAIDENNHAIELKLTQTLQVSGLHV